MKTQTANTELPTSRKEKKNNKKRSKNLTLIITSADKEQTLQGNEKKKSWQIDCRVCSFILFFFYFISLASHMAKSRVEEMGKYQLQEQQLKYST